MDNGRVITVCCQRFVGSINSKLKAHSSRLIVIFLSFVFCQNLIAQTNDSNQRCSGHRTPYRAPQERRWILRRQEYPHPLCSRQLRPAGNEWYPQRYHFSRNQHRRPHRSFPHHQWLRQEDERHLHRQGRIHGWQDPYRVRDRRDLRTPQQGRSLQPGLWYPALRR